MIRLPRGRRALGSVPRGRGGTKAALAGPTSLWPAYRNQTDCGSISVSVRAAGSSFPLSSGAFIPPPLLPPRSLAALAWPAAGQPRGPAATRVRLLLAPGAAARLWPSRESPWAVGGGWPTREQDRLSLPPDSPAGPRVCAHPAGWPRCSDPSPSVACPRPVTRRHSLPVTPS